MPKLASYNGKVDSIENIKVSPMSRAFLFSDSVYEVISFYKNEFIDFETHLDRLKHSLNETKISCSIDHCEIEIKKLLNESEFENGYIYYQVSRGVDSIRSHFAEESDCERFGFIEEFSFFNQSPLKVMLVDDIRWQRCDIKSTSLLGNVLQMNDAKSVGCNEILMHKNGELTEGGASNIFFVKNKTIFTPELSPNILPGITRHQVIKIIKDVKKNGDKAVLKYEKRFNKNSVIAPSIKQINRTNLVINSNNVDINRTFNMNNNSQICFGDSCIDKNIIDRINNI